MQVVIRVDASLQIGTGHVMRCLTLASALKEKGAIVQFICRELPGDLIASIEGKGFIVHKLQAHKITILNDFKADDLSHASWLTVTQEQDAKECQALIENINPDWLIVDHYAIDSRWENQLKANYRRLMVIDDLANRKHESALLLDQTFGRKVEDYKSLVPQDCHLLLGSQYALLRPEFSYWREYSLKRRADQELKKIIITMGGVDSDNVTGQALEILKVCDLPKDLTIMVVMGATALNLHKVKQMARSMPYETEVKVNVTNMAELMANADIAIGASGTTTWERCCLGLPSIQVVIADNQIAIAKILSSVNAIRYIEDLNDLQSNLNEIIESCRKISFIASSIIDGRGCEMVCNCFLSKTTSDESITLKPVDTGDCEFVYSLQTEDARKYSRSPAKPAWEEHVRWFKKTIESESSVLFIVMLNQHPMGILRLDNIRGNEVEISIIVAPDFTGQGIAKKTLLHAFKMQPGRSFKAVIHKDNVLSKKVFEKLGFSKVSESGFFIEYVFPNCEL